MSTNTSSTSTIPAVLVGDERTVYTMAADRARMAYRRKHGAPVLQTIAERRAWTLAHAVPMATAAERAGMTAVRKMHRARVERLATMSDPTRVGGAASGDFLAILAGDAMHSRARLDALEPVRKTTAKTTARKPATRKNSRVAAEKLAATSPKISPVVDVPETVASTPTSTPDTVPAPMPRMTRAAAKQTRREIAAAMRADGLRPEGEEWARRCAAAGLVVRDAVPA